MASILTLTVDRLVKFRLLREASKSIFEHMIGFDHEPELREELRKIALDTRLYQRDYRFTCHIEEGENGMVLLTLTKEVEVVNQSMRPESYLAGFRFNLEDRPVNCILREIIDGKPIRESEPILRTSDTSVVACQKSIDILPRRNKKRFRFEVTGTITQPRDWYHTMYFGFPTIDVMFSVYAPEGWSVWIGESQPDKATNTANYHDHGIKMKGEKLEIHWRNRP